MPVPVILYRQVYVESFLFVFLCGWEKEKNMAFVIELLLIGVGLSMDAFAVSVCKGLAMRKVNKKQAVVIGLFFGGFQALMPFVGWLLGSQFEKYITSIDHWIAFILLGIIGGKMIVESVKPDKEDDEVKEMDAPLDLKEMFVLAVATSIDALEWEAQSDGRPTYIEYNPE